jgi:hypothetical protein
MYHHPTPPLKLFTLNAERSSSHRVCGWCNERYVLLCAADYLQAVGDCRHVGNLPHKPSDLAVTGVVSKLYLCLLPISRMQGTVGLYYIAAHTNKEKCRRRSWCTWHSFKPMYHTTPPLFALSDYLHCMQEILLWGFTILYHAHKEGEASAEEGCYWSWHTLHSLRRMYHHSTPPLFALLHCMQRFRCC